MLKRVDEPERYFSGEDELAALLLAMVIDHCAGYSWEDQRAGLTSYLHAPHTTEDDLDSYGSAANADGRATSGATRNQNSLRDNRDTCMVPSR